VVLAGREIKLDLISLLAIFIDDFAASELNFHRHRQSLVSFISVVEDTESRLFGVKKVDAEDVLHSWVLSEVSLTGRLEFAA